MHTFLALIFFLIKFPDMCSMGQLFLSAMQYPSLSLFPTLITATLNPYLPTPCLSACFVCSWPTSPYTGFWLVLSPGSAMNWAPASTMKPLSLEAPYFPPNHPHSRSSSWNLLLTPFYLRCHSPFSLQPSILPL